MHRPPSQSTRRILAVAVIAAFVISSCGDDDDDDDAAGSADVATTAEAAPTATTAAPAPEPTEAASTAPADSATASSTADTTEGGGEDVGVTLILKTLANPFFVSMAESAEAEAETVGVSLTIAAGQDSGDTDSQIDAIEAAVARGDAGILITPSGDAVIPALDAARAAGLYTIALDTPPNPATAVDITFATDNFEAGQLIGQWTAGTLAGEKATIAMLDEFIDKVTSVDLGRDQGFLNGMGIIDEVDTSGNGNEPPTGNYSGGEYEIVCHEPSGGAVDGGRTAMETCLAQNPDINVVYTINEPTAQGAFDALTAAGVADDVIIVSVDGGCSPGLELVASGVIGATAQQYPGLMATLGMQAIKDLADGAPAPEVTEGLDFFNTGVALVTDSPVDGVESISVAEGQELCWG